MKDQYVGDVNDYLKYALLRALAGDDLAVAVVWMLTSSDASADGQRLSYLDQPERYRRLDPPLFDVLHHLVTLDERHVGAIERAEVLPSAVYFSDGLKDDFPARRLYFERAWQVTERHPLIFFDPDNGLAVASVSKGRLSSAKYLYWDELEAAYERGHSLVVYQHFPRRPRMLFIRQIAQRVREVTDCDRVMALTTSHVAFLVVPQTSHEGTLGARLDEFSTHAAPYATAVVSTKR